MGWDLLGCRCVRTRQGELWDTDQTLQTAGGISGTCCCVESCPHAVQLLCMQNAVARLEWSFMAAWTTKLTVGWDLPGCRCVRTRQGELWGICQTLQTPLGIWETCCCVASCPQSWGHSFAWATAAAAGWPDLPCAGSAPATRVMSVGCMSTDVTVIDSDSGSHRYCSCSWGAVQPAAAAGWTGLPCAGLAPAILSI